MVLSHKILASISKFIFSFTEKGIKCQKVILILMLSMLEKKISRLHFETFFFSKKIDFGISCKLSPKETICMKCQSLYSMKNKKNINSLSTELSQRMVKGNTVKLRGLKPLWDHENSFKTAVVRAMEGYY